MIISWLLQLLSISWRNAKTVTRPVSRRKSRFESLERRAMMTMVAPVTLSSGPAASAVQIADFNGDGKADVVMLNAATSSVSVQLGNGDGTFQAGVSSNAGAACTQLSVADFNHDGKLDIVALHNDTATGAFNSMATSGIELLKGNGDGTFQAPINYYTSAWPNDMDVGDVNNDGLPDMFTASFTYGGTTQLFLNDGAGGFLPYRNISIGMTGMHVKAGDFNGDGNLDLVESSGFGNGADILIGHGDGTFASPVYFTIGAMDTDMQVADLNHDGKAELITTSGNTVSVFSSNGLGSLSTPTTYQMTGANHVKIGDINGDGNRDVVGNNGMVLLGRGDGGFYASTNYGTAAGASIGLGDLNSDGILDVVAANSAAAGGGVNETLNANNDLQLLAGATQISVATTGSASAGTPFAVTVTALDANGNVVTGFQGAVGIVGAAGTTPTSYTFTAADNGVHTVANAATLFALGTGAYTVTSPFLPDATGSVDVGAGQAKKFTLTANQISAVAGTATSVTIAAFDAWGNATTNYLGTVHLTSGDAQAGLPSDYTFTADDAGVHTFDVALKTVGAQNVTATDSVTGTIKGVSATVSVTPAAAAALSVSAPTGYVGSVNAVNIQARDAFGNAATSYNGLVHLSSSDPGTTVSADATLFNGVATMTFTPAMMGPQTLTVSSAADGSISGSSVVNVTPGWGARFAVTPLPGTTAAGQTQTTTLTVYDTMGNVSTVYTGYVLVSAGNDWRSSSLVYFSAADAGVKTISVTLYTAGVQAVTFTDYLKPGVTFTQTGITVTAGEAASIALTPLQSTRAGVTQNATVSARDIYGNVASGYTGTIHFASSDTQAAIPGDYTFTASDAGSHTFALTYKSAGGQDITVSDTATHPAPQYYQVATWTYYQRDIMIAADVLSTYSFKGGSLSNTAAGTAFSLTISASDAYGNAITGYVGTARFSTTDVQGSLPSSYTFTAADAGTHVFAMALKTAGAQSISLTDSANSSVTSALAVTVKAAAASKLAITTSTASNAGTAQTVTVAVTDAYGNAVTSYTGAVKLTSSDAQAILPANYAFSNKDSGVHTFSVTLKTAGNQSITVADTVNATIAATQSGIVVTPITAAVASFGITGSLATTAGAAKAFTVTAKDAQGNVISGYTGTIIFSSSDVKAGLPASYTFTAADAGVHTFAATFVTAGTQSLTVKDSATSSSLGSQTGIVVSAGVATQFVMSTPTSATQGTGFKFTVTVYDAYGNIATGYVGKVHLSSTDSKAGASDYTFSKTDAGVHVFSYTFSTLGVQTLTVADTSSSLFKSKSNFNVVAK